MTYSIIQQNRKGRELGITVSYTMGKNNFFKGSA